MKINWNELVESHYRAIYAFHFQLSSNKAEAEDLTQETFLKVFKAFDAGRDFPTNTEEQKFYLYRVARNCFYDKFRFLQRFANFIKNTEIETEWHDDALKRDLADAINKLPARQKEVFILRHWHGFSTKEAAKILEINEGSVKSHLSRAIDKLQQEVKTTD